MTSPASTPPGSNTASRPPSLRTSGRHAILVVDDEPAIRLFLSEALGDEGYDVQTAATIVEAERLWGERRYDLALLDKNLPDGNGLDLARSLSEPGSDHDVVLMSGYASLTSAVEAMQYNVADYFVKPLDLNDMLARLKKVFRMQSLRRQNVRLVTELRAQNDFLESLAVRDHLTELYNHAFFQETLQREVLRSRRDGPNLSMLFVDIDRFKEVNDQKGHLTGDRVLKVFADILQGRSRRTDSTYRLSTNDIVSRYAGDEFALILPGTSKAGAAVLAENLRTAVQNFDFDEHGLPKLTVSVGVAEFPADASDRIGLVSCADVALYAAKRSGRNRVVSYHAKLMREGKIAEHEAVEESRRFDALTELIEKKQLKYVYQPIVNTELWTIVAYEGLCRPQNPAFAHPGELLETAERSGRISELGRVLRVGAAEALPQLEAPAKLFINLHPHELNDPRLHEFANAALDSAVASRIVLEVTESADIRDFGHVRDVLQKLRAKGFKIALDDLGAGYAGLNSLSMLEPDYVKLDMGIVQRISSSKRTARLIGHLLEFCADEGAEVIAEGIETASDLAAIEELGVTLMQGYYFARPGPPFVGIPSRDEL